MHHTDDLYIDGGLLCNYPIHAFDGKIYIRLLNFRKKNTA